MINIDLHIHPSPWKIGPDAYHSFAREAIRQGVDIICFTEHGPTVNSDPRYRGLEEKEVESYVHSILQTKADFRDRLQVFCGIELDYHPDHLSRFQALADGYPFDFVLGSVHFIDDWHVNSEQGHLRSSLSTKSPEELYRIYYQQVIAAAECGLFDSLAHIDCIRRSLPHPPGQPPPYAEDIFSNLVEVLSGLPIAVEVNTRGMQIEAMHECHPTRSLLKKLIHAGVNFTIGSDAHHAVNVGQGLVEARRELYRLGVSTIHYFKKREMLTLEI